MLRICATLSDIAKGKRQTRRTLGRRNMNRDFQRTGMCKGTEIAGAVRTEESMEGVKFRQDTSPPHRRNLPSAPPFLERVGRRLIRAFRFRKDFLNRKPKLENWFLFLGTLVSVNNEGVRLMRKSSSGKLTQRSKCRFCRSCI